LCDPLSTLLGCVLAVAAWAAPQPQYSAGLLVTYGGQQLVEANAEYHGYDLGLYPGRCGLAAISPAMLGRVAFVRAGGSDWVGPCLVVDAVARVHAYDSIYTRHEIAEVSRATAAALGFEYGAPGFVWFGPCPPHYDSLYPAPLEYAPPLRWEDAGSPGRSFWPYAEQARPVDCGL
jgi:hypothetical protein